MNKKFKMEKVLEIREKALEREKLKLLEIMQKARKIKDELNVINADIISKINEMSEHKSQGDFDLIGMYNKYINVKMQYLSFYEAKLEEVKKEIAEQKEVLKKALNDVKIMEKLKENHLIAYREYEKKQENIMIDEINITRGYGSNTANNQSL